MTRAGRYAVIAAGVAGAVGFVVVTWLVSIGATEVLDAQLSVGVRSLRAPVLTSVMRIVTFAGGWLFVTAGTLVLTVALGVSGDRPRAAVVAVMVAGGASLSWAVKELVGRVRPPAASALAPLPTSDAFPSGHTMAASCLAAALLVAASGAPLRWRVAAMVAIVVYPAVVGFSRVYLGVHWPTDVAAAGLLALAWSAAVVLAGARWLEAARA